MPDKRHRVQEARQRLAVLMNRLPHGSRGQASIEYMLIIGFVMIMLLPVVYLLFTSLQEYQAETAYSQSFAAGREILATAERVYHHGPPSRLTVQVRMPAGIKNIMLRRHYPLAPQTCTKCTELLFNLTSGSTVSVSTAVDVRGSCATTLGGFEKRTLDDGSRSDECPLIGLFSAEGNRNYVLEVFTDSITGEDYVNLSLG
jgi:Flp pilus assembly pilin Flp